MPNVRLLTEVRIELSPLRTSFEDFILSRKATRCTINTLCHYQHSAGVFVKWLEMHNVEDPRVITAAHVRQWLAEATHLKDTSLHARARGARTFLLFLLAEGYISQRIPVAMPRLERRRLPYLDRAGLLILLKACPTIRHKAIILFFVDSGLRRDELIRLNGRDVEYQTGMVKVEHGKGGKSRVTFVGANTLRALLRYRRGLKDTRDESPLFQSFDGRRFGGNSLARLIRRVGKRAGMSISPHALRRTFARMSLVNGMNLLDISRLMGHASVEMTAHYIACVDGDLLASHERAGLDKWLT